MAKANCNPEIAALVRKIVRTSNAVGILAQTARLKTEEDVGRARSAVEAMELVKTMLELRRPPRKRRKRDGEAADEKASNDAGRDDETDARGDDST